MARFMLFLNMKKSTILKILVRIREREEFFVQKMFVFAETENVSVLDVSFNSDIKKTFETQSSHSYNTLVARQYIKCIIFIVL